jgi:hypothetical protein
MAGGEPVMVTIAVKPVSNRTVDNWPLAKRGMATPTDGSMGTLTRGWGRVPHIKPSVLSLTNNLALDKLTNADFYRGTITQKRTFIVTLDQLT